MIEIYQFEHLAGQLWNSPQVHEMTWIYLDESYQNIFKIQTEAARKLVICHQAAAAETISCICHLGRG